MPSLSKAYGIDEEKATNGVWFDFLQGIECRIRYINGTAFTKVQGRVFAEHRRRARGGNLSADQQILAMKDSAAEGLLVDWRGVTTDDGRARPATPEEFRKAFDEQHDFYLAVLARGGETDRFEFDAVAEDQEGNSSRASGTTSSSGERSSSPTIHAVAREAG